MDNKQIKISYAFADMSDSDQTLAKDIVQKNIEGKMDSYFKKILNNPDSEIRIEYKIKFNEASKKYDADFTFSFDGDIYIYKKEWFKILEDLVNHAFQHFKENLSKK